ncbi:MAG: hypothetical protein WCT04_20050 [Planctomycetota bacterium]
MSEMSNTVEARMCAMESAISEQAATITTLQTTIAGLTSGFSGTISGLQSIDLASHDLVFTNGLLTDHS